MNQPPYLVITGLSGSGKSLVHNCLEDMGYYCVDNLPLRLIERFFDLIRETSREISRVAVVTDLRERSFLSEFVKTYVELRTRFDVQLLYLEASEEVLIQRFSETRRPHPLSDGRPLTEALRLEREMMVPVRELADTIVDTSSFNVHQVREHITRILGPDEGAVPLVLSIESFGFKHGVPREADLVFDVRFLPNPYFEARLKEKNGLDYEVVEYVRGQPDAGEFLERLTSFLRYLIPKYVDEGKAYLTICIGCTGGQHRSVVMAAELAAALKDLGFAIHVKHRGLERG